MKDIYGCHCIISDHEQIVGGNTSDWIIQVIITIVEDAIYLK